MPTISESAFQWVRVVAVPDLGILPAYQRETPICDRIAEAGMLASSGWIRCENTSPVSQAGCVDASHSEHACACRRLTCTGLRVPQTTKMPLSASARQSGWVLRCSPRRREPGPQAKIGVAASTPKCCSANHTCKITCKKPVLAVLKRTGVVPDGV
jgi:hypothetical protein